MSVRGFLGVSITPLLIGRTTTQPPAMQPKKSPAEPADQMQRNRSKPVYIFPEANEIPSRNQCVADGSRGWKKASFDTLLNILFRAHLFITQNPKSLPAQSLPRVAGARSLPALPAWRRSPRLPCWPRLLAMMSRRWSPPPSKCSSDTANRIHLGRRCGRTFPHAPAAWPDAPRP